MTRSSHQRDEKKRWQKCGGSELWQDFCFVPRLEKNISWRETLDRWHDGWLAATLVIWIRSREWQNPSYTWGRNNIVKRCCVTFVRGAAASPVKRCKNKNKNKRGNNFGLNERTQPLTVTTTRVVREKERGKDRRRACSKTKGTWQLPILYFLCVTVLRYSAEGVNASTSVNAFRRIAPVRTKFAFAGTYVRNQNETVHTHAVTFIS